MKQLLFSFFAGFFALGLIAQNADAVIDRNEILIGEQAMVRLSYRVDKNAIPVVGFPQMRDTLIKGIEILEISGIDTLVTSENVNETRLEQRLLITSFDTGYYAIPPFEFKVGEEMEKTRPFLLTVRTVEIDTTGSIRLEKPNLTVDVSFMDYVRMYWPYGAGVLGLAILTAILFLLVKRYRSRPKQEESTETVVPEIPPYELALQELNRLKEEKIYERGQLKAFHTDLTDILREYLETGFGIRAHEYTSTQIFQQLRFAEIPDSSMKKLRKILLRADMVKFAKEHPDKFENEESVILAIDFVRDTIPNEENNG